MSNDSNIATIVSFEEFQKRQARRTQESVSPFQQKGVISHENLIAARTQKSKEQRYKELLEKRDYCADEKGMNEAGLIAIATKTNVSFHLPIYEDYPTQNNLIARVALDLQPEEMSQALRIEGKYHHLGDSTAQLLHSSEYTTAEKIEEKLLRYLHEEYYCSSNYPLPLLIDNFDLFSVYQGAQTPTGYVFSELKPRSALMVYECFGNDASLSSFESYLEREGLTSPDE